MKHRTAPGIRKDTPFNVSALTQGSVIIVESPIDALTLLQNNFNAVAVLSSNMSYEMVNLFYGRVCYLLFDRDEAGQLGAEVVGRKLWNKTNKIFTVSWPDGLGKMDVNRFFLEEKNAKKRLIFLLKNSAPLSKPRFIYTRGNKKNKKNKEDEINIKEIALQLFDPSELTENNNSLWRTCPVHLNGNERTPSLQIGGSKNIFYCYGCHVGGGPTKLVSWVLSVTEKEAKQWINARFS